ncbi:retinaldehyde-binding protein 1 [Folsomia candida]|uniref:Retinaldehyde-binding protein 1 n=1 Tax=Folsomia candida TaxID=158441 RepID=A0A226CWG7_FOLCA|nr:retinaldehyde-binding protein 1 [Folsomia candida]OXA37299.1 Retinaldehyde-binding protein 1 [Folsomia candida]
MLSNIDSQDMRIVRLRNKAKLEIGETNEDLIPERIQELKELIKEEGGDKFHMHPSRYDDFYLKCLRARKYDVDRAAKLYKKYCNLRTNTLHMVPKLLPSCHAHLYHDKLCSILKFRDNRGRHVFIVRVEKWDAKETTFDDFLSTLFLLLDEIIISIDTQLHGVTVIGDLKGLGLSHVRLVSPNTLRTAAGVLQDSYPARFKEFHAINNPFVFNMIWALGKPFLKDKIRKRMYFHGGDFASLHRSLSIDAKLLPDFLGGSVPEKEYADLNIINSLLKKDDHFKDFFKYGYTART